MGDTATIEETRGALLAAIKARAATANSAELQRLAAAFHETATTYDLTTPGLWGVEAVEAPDKED